MRTVLLASAAMLCLGGAALAQNSASPASGKASNITGSDTRSAVAPRLPTPDADDPDRLLAAAQNALSRGRTGEAQEALERAETRLLDRSTPSGAASTPISEPRIDAIRQALSSLGSGDRAGAKAAITTAMGQPATSGGMMGNGSMGNGSMGDGMMGNGSMGNGMGSGPVGASGVPAARPGVNPSSVQPPGGPSVAPASGPGSTAPINPAGQIGGTGNQGSP